MYDEAMIDNAAMAIKDRLLGFANYLDHDLNRMDDIRPQLERINEVLGQLDVMRPLWKAIRYSYKGKEIIRPMAEAIRQWMYNTERFCVGPEMSQTWQRCTDLIGEFHADECG